MRYVLEGSVRKAGARLLIAGQLSEASTAAQLWAEQFDGPLEDVFELQDRIASRVAGIIDPLLLDTEIERGPAHRRSDLLRSVSARAAADPGLAREPIAQAIVFLERAVARDPALASLALCHSQNFLSGWGDAAAEREQGLARRARDAAPDDPMTVTSAAGALLNLGEIPIP